MKNIYKIENNNNNNLSHQFSTLFFFLPSNFFVLHLKLLNYLKYKNTTTSQSLNEIKYMGELLFYFKAV